MRKKKRVTTYANRGGYTLGSFVKPGSQSKTKTVTRKKNIRTKTKRISTSGILTKTRTVSAGASKFADIIKAGSYTGGKLVQKKPRQVSAKRAKRIRRKIHKQSR